MDVIGPCPPTEYGEGILTPNPYHESFRSQASSELKASLPFDFRENNLGDGSANEGDLATGIDSSVSGLEGNIIVSNDDRFFSLDDGYLDTSLDSIDFSFNSEDQVSGYTEDGASLFS